jgi:hypothetical protein
MCLFIYLAGNYDHNLDRILGIFFGENTQELISSSPLIIPEANVAVVITHFKTETKTHFFSSNAHDIQVNGSFRKIHGCSGHTARRGPRAVAIAQW